MPPPDSRTTRTTNRGGGVETNERVLSVARGGSRDRRWGTVVPVAAQRRSAGAERAAPGRGGGCVPRLDRKSTRLNSSHTVISYAVFCLKKKKKHAIPRHRRHETRSAT